MFGSLATREVDRSTWTQWIVRLIQNEGQPGNMEINQASPWVEGISGISTLIDMVTHCSEMSVDDLPRPRTLKSHFPYNIFPCGVPHETPCKYIYVARNPKDVTTSLYCMAKQAYNPHIVWGTFFKSQIGGYVAYGDYFDHVLSWWSRRNEKNVLFLKYEDRKKDLSGQIKQIADFLGAKLSSDTFSKIVELASFPSMKKDDRVNVSWAKNYDKDGEPMFLRKGVVGDWKNFFTPEDSREMDIRCAEKLEGTGLEFEYE